MEEVMEQRAPHGNSTTGFPIYSVVIPFLFITVVGCVLAIVVCVRRRRLDELRHRLIPLYSYDPTEVEEEEDNWGDGGTEDEQTEPLYKEGKLSFPSVYGS